MNTDRGTLLLERARAGDEAARGELLEVYRPYVRAIARGLGVAKLRGRLDDSDLIQDTMLAAHSAFAGFRGGTMAEFAAWLRQIAVRTVQRVLRDNLDVDKRSLAAECAVDMAGIMADGSTPSSRSIRDEDAARIAAAIERLPEDMRLVILGRHQEERSHEELAEQLQRSAGAVRVLYTRALRQLRAILSDS